MVKDLYQLLSEMSSYWKTNLLGNRSGNRLKFSYIRWSISLVKSMFKVHLFFVSSRQIWYSDQFNTANSHAYMWVEVKCDQFAVVYSVKAIMLWFTLPFTSNERCNLLCCNLPGITCRLLSITLLCRLQWWGQYMIITLRRNLDKIIESIRAK